MIAIPFILHAKERIILSATSASAGQHECLDYLPGSALLGAFASLEYKQGKTKDPDTVFHLFHSGAVSFGDAYPLSPDGSPCIRIPLSFHQAKAKAGSPATSNNKKGLCSEKTFNLSATAREDNGDQLVQMRNEWMTASGALTSVDSGYVLKTARDSAKRGTAADGQLFGFSYIESGQSFCGCIYVSDDQEHLVEKLKTWISKNDSVFIGRSHNAEFGRCELSPLPEDPHAMFTPSSPDEQKTNLPEEIRLLALSDWWFPTGLPTEGASFHPLLEDYSLTPDRTFARFRTYSPWNSFRGVPDPQRHVVSKGSVITLTLKEDKTPPEISLSDLRKPLRSDGLGAGQSDGLGRTLVHPSLLDSKHPAFSTPSPILDQPQASEKSAPRPENPYLPQIERRWVQAWVQMEADSYAKELISSWKNFRPQPEKSQWAQLRGLARKSSSPDSMLAEFKQFTRSGAAKYKWEGMSRGQGHCTLTQMLLQSWETFSKQFKQQNDPRSKISGSKEQIYLQAVAEATRRLRELK